MWIWVWSSLNFFVVLSVVRLGMKFLVRGRRFERFLERGGISVFFV